MKVLVVDDSALMRRAVSQMLASDPGIEVIGTAKNGKEGLAMANSLEPDVITMDIEMPEMDGLTALRQIMKQCPTQVLMLSSLTIDGSHAALQALKIGAADVLAKDTTGSGSSATDLQRDLVTRVRALGGARRRHSAGSVAPNIDQDKVPNFRPGQFDMVCIGSSTGGPPVLERVLTALPESFSAPVVVAQHMPELFTKSMAQRLDQMCRLRVVHAHDRMGLEPHTIYIAPGGKHTHISKQALGRLELLVNNEPAGALYKPGVDALFHSAAMHCGSRTLAVVMTGIGSDGLEGARALHARGGVIMAQDEASCVVYGMPKAVSENKLTVALLTPDGLAAALVTLASGEVQTPVAKAG